MHCIFIQLKYFKIDNSIYYTLKNKSITKIYKSYHNKAKFFENAHQNNASLTPHIFPKLLGTFLNRTYIINTSAFKKSVMFMSNHLRVDSLNCAKWYLSQSKS